MVCGQDYRELRGLLVSIARYGGVAVDEETLERLAPIVARSMANWRVLADLATPGVEPMTVVSLAEIESEME